MNKLNKTILISAIILILSFLVLAELTHNDNADLNPQNNTYTNETEPLFYFNFSSTTNETFTCDLFIDGVVNATNESVDNNTLTAIQSTVLSEGTYDWYINCTDDGGSLTSEIRQITVDTTAPSVISIEFSHEQITRANIGENYTVNVTFDETMNESIDLISAEPFTPTIIGTHISSCATSEWINSTTYQYNWEIIDNSSRTLTISFTVNAARDLAGNLQDENLTINALNIDTEAPDLSFDENTTLGNMSQDWIYVSMNWTHDDIENYSITLNHTTTEYFNETLNEQTHNFTDLSEGVYELKIWANDTFNNEQELTRIITLDTTEPNMNEILMNGLYGPNTWNETHSIKGQVNDELTSVEEVLIILERLLDNFYWNGTDWNDTITELSTTSFDGENWTYTFQSSNLTDGEYNVTAIARDYATNTNTTTITFEYDSIPPTGYSIDINELFVNLNNQENITFRMYDLELDSTYSLEVTIDGVGGNVTSSGLITSLNQNVSLNISSLSDGNLIITLRLIDSASNEGTLLVNTEYYKDTVLPAVVNIVPEELIINKTLLGENQTFLVNFSEAVTNAVIYVNEAMQTLNNCGNVLNETWCFNYTIPEMNYTVMMINVTNATDIAGNMMLENSTYTFQIDTVAPTIENANMFSNNANTSWAKTGDNVTIAFNTSEAIDNVHVTINGNDTVLITNTSSTEWFATRTMNENEAQGPVSFTIDFTDIIGNPLEQQGNETLAPTVTFDNILPVIHIISPVQMTYNVSEVLLNLSATELNLNTIIYNWNGTNETYSEPTILSILDDDYLLTVWAEDMAGNINQTNTMFSVDTTPPVTTLNATSDGTYEDNTWAVDPVEINISACADVVSGCNITYYYVNGASEFADNGSAPMNFTLSEPGIYVITYFSVDNIGNVELTKNFTVKISAPGPERVGGSWSFPEDATPESATNVTLLGDLVIEVGSGAANISLQANTTITSSDGSALNLSALTSNETNTSVLVGLTNMAGAVQFGIPNFGLVFDKPVTISIFVGAEYDNETLSIWRSISGTSGWTQDGIEEPKTCYVEDGICEFNITKASYFATGDLVVETPAPSSSPSTTTSQPASHVFVREDLFLQGFDRWMRNGQGLRFNVGDAQHSLTVDSVSESMVTVTVASTPQTNALGIGDEWRVNVNNDEYYDLLVVLEEIDGDRARVKITGINEVISTPVVEESTPQVVDDVVEDDVETEPVVVEETIVEEVLTKPARSTPGLFWAILVIVFLLLIFMIFGKKKK